MPGVRFRIDHKASCYGVLTDENVKYQMCTVRSLLVFVFFGLFSFNKSLFFVFGGMLVMTIYTQPFKIINVIRIRNSSSVDMITF